MKKFIKSLELRWSDLFLLIGFIPFAFFLVFGQLFMQFQNPTQVNFPLIAIIISFVVSLGSWWVYLVLEHEKNNFKVNYIAYIFIILIILNVIVIAAQPGSIHYDVMARRNVSSPDELSIMYEIGKFYPVNIDISPIHKTMFAMDVILVGLFIYIGLFVFPKRFKNLSFIKVLSWIIMAVMGVIILYSYITEYNNYYGFFKTLFSGGKFTELEHYTVKSFIIHRNAYGMAMLMGVIFAIINHSFNKKWFNYLLIGFFMFNMVFSLCKTSILIGALIIVIYVYFRLFYAFKEHKKRNLILLIVYSALILGAGAMVAIAYITKGDVFSFLYIYEGEGSTLQTRSWIWDNTYQTLQNGNWLIGHGFGIINLIILPMNTINGDPYFPTHSAFVNMIGEGGILYLLAFIALLIYVIYVISKCWKKNPNIVLALTIGAAAFFMYSFIETIQYLMYVFLFPIFIFYEISKREDELATKKLSRKRKKAIN